MKIKCLAWALVCLLVLIGCEDAVELASPLVTFETIESKTPSAKGDRLFGINISESHEGFLSSFDMAQQAGVQVVELNLPWHVIETKEGGYEDPWHVLRDIAFYGEHDIQVMFSLAVIDTVKRTTPAYLDELPYDDPRVIAAFNSMVDWVVAQVPTNVTVPSISIGNEVDLLLSGSEWEAYTRFYQATSAHIQENHPGIRVGVKVTVMHGMMQPSLVSKVQALNQSSDVIMLNYYPQDADFRVLPPEIVHEHFKQMVQHFPEQEIWFTEVGYQSGSEHCDSSEAKQATFYHELFAAWDTHQSQVKLVLVDWLHDQNKTQIAEWESYYGSSAPGFVEYLSTLGLRHYGDTDKAAWIQVLAETQARGWTE